VKVDVHELASRRHDRRASNVRVRGLPVQLLGSLGGVVEQVLARRKLSPTRCAAQSDGERAARLWAGGEAGSMSGGAGASHQQRAQRVEDGFDYRVELGV